MKVEISKEKKKKYTASLIPKQGPALRQTFNSPRGLLTFLRKQRNVARELGEPFELVRKSN